MSLKNDRNKKGYCRWNFEAQEKCLQKAPKVFLINDQKK